MIMILSMIQMLRLGLRLGLAAAGPLLGPGRCPGRGHGSCPGAGSVIIIIIIIILILICLNCFFLFWGGGLRVTGLGFRNSGLGLRVWVQVGVSLCSPAPAQRGLRRFKRSLSWGASRSRLSSLVRV